MNQTRVETWRKRFFWHREQLDQWRQKDNHILYDLGNPPRLDKQRGKILAKMRWHTGKMQKLWAKIEMADDGV